MSRKFIFTCKAASYTLPGGAQYVKGQVIEMSDDDPRIHLLRGNAAWGVKAGPVEALPLATPTEDTGGESGGSQSVEKLFKPPIANALKTAGYDTLSDLADADMDEDKLLAIDGIGPASAKKILAEIESSHLPRGGAHEDYEGELI